MSSIHLVTKNEQLSKQKARRAKNLIANTFQKKIVIITKIKMSLEVKQFDAHEEFI